MFIRSFLPWSLSAVLTAIPVWASADDTIYNRVSLSAEASQEVSNNYITVVLYTEQQNANPATVAQQTTQLLNSALTRAQSFDAVKVSLGSRQSYPVYSDNGQKITAWRERGEIRLEGTDFAETAKLTGELLGTLNMGQMQFSVSPPVRKQHENTLYKEAISAFRERAELITQAMGGKSYRIVDLNLNSSGGFAPPYPRMMMAAKMEADSTPNLAPGTQQISLTANGTIEVQAD